ncbi:biodegradative arginine decarboxylase [mine drainage metagenome]|uniref:Biodegradative arginine decarboxylase n=1 Tax=mine drainage metagenome TaxID=410659 RepID=A0A1J5RMR0_9ZZZZ
MKTVKESSCTPLADALIKLKSAESLTSFHALPLSRSMSITNCELADKYQELLGDTLLGTEMTLTGKYFDSFFFANGVIKEAEQLAANLFSADGTLFVTSGTTTSNQIAIHALHQDGGRVLLDRQCHQSMHFTLHSLRAKVDYLIPTNSCEHSGRNHWHLEQLVQKAITAKQNGEPYHLIVLNAQSYDGVIYNIPSVIEYLLKHDIGTRNFLIDEAWGAANYFNNLISKYAAMNIADSLMSEYPDLSVVATHSAHKSLSCMRQASMIHFRGSNKLRDRLHAARFQIHTTSPSYPILASLDLARAQMAIQGEALTRKVTYLAKMFIETISTDPLLNTFKTNKYIFPEHPFQYAFADPTKISLNVEELGIQPIDVKELLYAKYGIYINRLTETSLLLNFHIGIKQECVNKLISALRELQLAYPANFPIQGYSQEFIIPYPPGVPLIVPGESITHHIQKKIRDIQNSGVHVFSI